MRPLRYSINVTLDGCCHHEAGLPPDEESMRYWTAEMGRADALLFGRVTFEMMESAWRQPATGTWPDWMGEWEIPFAETIDRAKKHVVSSTLSGVEWNAELVRGDLGQAVQRLKQESGEGLWVGGVTLPLALADLGLIDEYEFVVQPVLAGHGPTLLAGLRERIQLDSRSLLGIGFERESKHGSLLRLVVEDHPRVCSNDDVEPRSDIGGRILGQQRFDRGLGVGGRQQRALAREVPVHGSPRDGRRLCYLLDRRRPSLGDDRTCRGHQRVAGPALLICAPVQLVRR